MTVAGVYKAKSTVLRMLREELGKLDDESMLAAELKPAEPMIGTPP